ADDLESLLYVANSASIPLHIWQSRVADISRPDFCVLDLDPKEAPFADVVRIALYLKELCDEIQLPSFVKTSGSTGLHVLVPLGRQVTYEHSRNIGHLLALMAVRELEGIATVARLPSQREGKVYVDFLQNGHGRLIVAPYCVRPLPGAPVSAPLDWSEVDDGLSIADHTIRTVPERMATHDDPMRDVLMRRPDLGYSLARLSELLGG
ncbi:MAG: DNA ligase, partial [Gemmatimonadetes bacterium]|nr:DNA ligase [Gemmatimonadota bacterium]